MRTLLAVALVLFTVSTSFSQKTKVPPKHYPSLLWEISKKGYPKKSYLFGTMHVSSKMVFHLSDSFYLGIKNADVVALETDMGSWQEDFSRYELDEPEMFNNFSNRQATGSPSDFMNIGTLQFLPYEKLIEISLHNSPSIINNFLYRSFSERASDFEEDTYLDLHIYQAGKKWGKKVCGVENFDESMELMKQAYLDASQEKDRKERSYDQESDFSYGKMEDAYRTGNLDLLDTINKVNSQSAAFDEKFLYRRNEIQANSIDSILKTRASLFVGVGAAHLPGRRGVIEMLRQMGYTLRPIKMTERDSRHKEEVEKIRVPVKFTRQTMPDGFFSVQLPGKLYEFSAFPGLPQQQQFADMTNGSYYMITRINTNSVVWGHDEATVLRKIDSVMYENIPGKILARKNITRNGYRGIEITNKTRRGDYQRYTIFVTPFEILLFKMSGNGEYVIQGKEADQFFNSIEIREYTSEWKKWGPGFGGFEAEWPHTPLVTREENWQFVARDQQTGIGFSVIRTDIHNYDFTEEDSFDLNLMEESFGASEFIDRQISRKHVVHHGYPALEARYRYKDGSVAEVKFLIRGPNYYTILAQGKKEHPKMKQFLNSFRITPFVYGPSVRQTDTSLYFTVSSPVALEKPKKISMYPENMMREDSEDDDSFFEESGTYRDKIVTNDSTGEKIYVSFRKLSRYYYDADSTATVDTTHFKTDKMNWVFRKRVKQELPNRMKVLDYVLADPQSSRYVRGKVYSRDGVSFRLETQGDTIRKESDFISQFYNTFTPADTVSGNNPRTKKSGLFFSDFFSTDTLLHKRAVKNVSRVYFDSSDFGQLKKSILALNWKEKKYMEVKKDFVRELSSIPTKASAEFLKEIYYAASDTIELQYVALESLLSHKTQYAYQVFRDIMMSEPPVLMGNTGFAGNRVTVDNEENYSGYRNRFFFNRLTDSVKLTATIINDLLPLISVNDYERPMMDLMGILIDSGMLTAKDYGQYQTKFLLEARQLMKKQIINEKNKSIERAQDDDAPKARFQRYNEEDGGNNLLSLYATLLLPFYDKNPAVPQLMNQMLLSNDKRLKYNTTVLLLQHRRPVPDTLVRFFAGLDEFRYELYSDLKKNRLLDRYPKMGNFQADLAKSKLVGMTNMYNKPDSIQYLDKLPIQHKDRSGYVYFFRYKEKKDDETWKLATVGMVPADSTVFEYDKKKKFNEERQYSFNDLSETKITTEEPLQVQMSKLLRKMQYAKRNSAAEFYNDDARSKNFLRSLNFRD